MTSDYRVTGSSKVFGQIFLHLNRRVVGHRV